MKKSMYNKELVFEKIKKSGGLLVSQLYESLTESERPSRNYFVQFIRSIPGVYLMPYDTRQNCLFVTTAHGMELGKKRLLIMSEAIRQQEPMVFNCLINLKELPQVYNNLIKGTKPYRKDEYGRWIYDSMNLDIARDGMNHFLSHQKQTLNNHNSNANDASGKITMEDGPIKPNITLLNLFRRHIYLYPHLNKNGHLEHMEFKVLDSEDNFTNRKISQITIAINDFMHYHNIHSHYTITIYVGNQRKLELYSSRLKVRADAIERAAEIKDKSLKKERFEKNFDGYNFINVNMSRYFVQNGLDYGNSTSNRELLKNNDPELLEIESKKSNYRNRKIKSY